MPLLVLVIGWILTIFLGILAFIILWKIATNEISLRYLISDELGYASLSRFQFLLFTFVIAMTLVYLIAAQGRFRDSQSDSGDTRNQRRFFCGGERCPIEQRRGVD